MGKIVVNKHFDLKAQVSPEKFTHKGEIIISNQVGYEGIFIVNRKGDMLFIGPTSGTGANVPIEYKEYIETYVDGVMETAFEGYLTSGETIELIKASASSETVNEEEIKSIISGELQTVLSVYFTSAQTESYVSERLKDYATKDSVQEIAALEVAKIVDSADTSFDTLREIAEWIANDTQSAATLANDVKELKGISADTRIAALEAVSADTRLNDLEQLSHSHNNLDIINKINEESINLWNNAEENAKAYASGYTESALTGYATEKYVKDAIATINGAATSSNFMFLSTEEYEKLVADGSIEINGETYVYDENIYYALYEPEE